MKSAGSAKKALHWSETKTREMMKGTEEKSVFRGVIHLPSIKSMIFYPPDKFCVIPITYSTCHSLSNLFDYLGRHLHLEPETPGAWQTPVVHPVRGCARPGFSLHGEGFRGARPHPGEGVRARGGARGSGHVPVQVHLRHSRSRGRTAHRQDTRTQR